MSKPSTQLAIDQGVLCASARPGSLLAKRYRLAEPLGVGGYAVVFSAVDIETREDVAIKLINPRISRDRAVMMRFEREAEFAGSLTSPHTVRVLDSGQTQDGCLYLVMELLKGRPLDRVLEREGTLNEEDVTRILRHVLTSLAEAHERGIVHRDIKPGNVFLDDRGAARVLDFGISKSVDESPEAARTATGSLVCSPHYVAPERLLERRSEPQNDIYAVGLMTIELLEGRPPIRGATPAQLVVEHTRLDVAVPMSEQTRATALAPFLERATEKIWGLRYRDAGAFLAALDAGDPYFEQHASATAPTLGLDDPARLVETIELAEDAPAPAASGGRQDATEALSIEAIRQRASAAESRVRSERRSQAAAAASAPGPAPSPARRRGAIVIAAGALIVTVLLVAVFARRGAEPPALAPTPARAPTPALAPAATPPLASPPPLDARTADASTAEAGRDSDARRDDATAVPAAAMAPTEESIPRLENDTSAAAQPAPPPRAVEPPEPADGSPRSAPSPPPPVAAAPPEAPPSAAADDAPDGSGDDPDRSRVIRSFSERTAPR